MTFKDGKKEILVIDDDPVQIKLLEKRLPENGYAVLTATKAAEGLQMAIDKHPDLIVLDVMMPIINGYNLCQLLKAEEKHKNIPVIMLTSRDKEKDIKIGHNVGADAYLIKPVDVPILLQKIEELLRN
ncbi:MAG: response regulator [Candidatus Aceula meridiana]|nr:response regulator [Candidatus Aceula meridiana]